jgi:transposase InsO family protein
LLRDRDGVYGSDVRSRIASLPIEEVLTAPRSPWQNPYAERLIGSIRRECLDHFIILNARHLKRTLASFLISVITTGRGLTSGWTSHARFPGRSPVPGGLFKPPNLEAYTTAMNVSQREGLGADGIMANDKTEHDCWLRQRLEAANRRIAEARQRGELPPPIERPLTESEQRRLEIFRGPL